MKIKNYSACLLIFGMLCSSSLFAQGIDFVSLPDWKSTMDLAKKNGKYILVDVYATWCAPCKKMDDEVYNQKEAGLLVNNNCLAIKAQMDSTGNDSKHVQDWYNDSKNLINKYNITSLPTILFFAPDGTLINKTIGYKSLNEFIAFIKESTDTANSLAHLLKMQKVGKLPYSKYLNLISKLRLLGEDSTANLLGNYFINNYLEKLSIDSLLSNCYLNFYGANNNLINSSMRIFKIILNNTATIDTLMHNKAFSTVIINNVLNREEVYPVLYPDNNFVATEPQWESVEDRIEKKSNLKVGGRLVLEAKIKYYQAKKYWKNYCRELIRRVEQYGDFNTVWPGTEADFNFNNLAWELFQFSNDKKQLAVGLQWSNKAISLNPIPNWIDTKANLLYKLGRKKEAIVFEQEVIEKAKSAKDGQLREFEKSLDKMRKGIPTWPSLK